MPRPRKIRPALTKRAIDAGKPAATGRDTFLWDGSDHGLGVKITGTGAKVLIFQKSIRGKLRRITLGKWGDVTLEAARTRARQLNGEIAKGRDPIADERARREEEERRERSEKTVSDLWARYWLEVVTPGNRSRTASEKRYMWKSRIEASIGAIRLKDVTDEDAGAIVRNALRTDEGGNITGGRGAAGNVYRLLHHMFAKALSWGLRPRELGNPLDSTAEPKVARRERLLSDKEVGALLSEIERTPVRTTTPKPTKKPDDKAQYETALAAIKAVFLTGARISEILNLRWTEVRKDELELHLADTKTGFSRRPISAEALEVIAKVERRPGCPYVFRSPKDATRPVEYTLIRKTFERIAKRAGVANCTLHTVRHWFSTLTANAVSNPRVGMALTGHKSHAAYMTYIHKDKEQARALADQLGAFAVSLTAANTVTPVRASKQ